MNKPCPLDELELDVVFQPIFRLSNRSLLGYEALGRVRPQAFGAPRGPAALLERAQEGGYLLDLDRRWRRLAIETIARTPVPEDVLFFLNVDTRVLDDSRFVAGYTDELLCEHGISPDRIVFELTERDPLLRDARVRQLIRHYAEQGFHIALDDLGTQYASLDALVELQPDIAKLDRSLVRGIGDSTVRKHLMQALTFFAQRVEILLVAEGIETQDELAALQQAGVEYGQGFLLGKPLPLRPSPAHTDLRGRAALDARWQTSVA